MTLLSITNIQQAFNGTYNGTRTGTVTDTTQGSGTYSNTVSHQGGVATFDDLTTYANGNTAETKTSISKNANGSFDETIQKYVDGKEEAVSPSTFSSIKQMARWQPAGARSSRETSTVPNRSRVRKPWPTAARTRSPAHYPRRARVWSGTSP